MNSQAKASSFVDPHAPSATTLARRIRARELSPVEVVEASLARIEAVQEALNPFAFVHADAAREAARAAEAVVMRGAALGPLHGVPIAIKDFTPTAGDRTTRGSYAFEHWVPEHDPVIVTRLRAAGAIIVGKTTTPEFAHSSFTRSPLFGHTRNPHDPARSSGGSSGGSAVAVATGCVALAEGTDMGGSVRIPAALCGVVGHKPSLGRIPMDILPTVFDSISHFGPLARNVADAALFVRVTEGPSDADIQSQREPVPLPDLAQASVAGLRIAMSEDLGFYAVEDAVRDNLHAAAARLCDAGARVKPVELPWQIEITQAWLAYWGVYLAAAFGDQLDQFRERMDPELVALMDDGLAMGAVAFKRLENVRTRQWLALAEVFRDYDVLICPTMARTAPLIDAPESHFERIDDKGALHGLEMTSPFNNLAQCAALSIPSGFDAAGLPTAVQIVSRRFDDATALTVGAVLEASGRANAGLA